MLRQCKRSLLFSLAAMSLGFSLYGSSLSYADQESSSEENIPRSHGERHHGKKEAFKLGVCVGQYLSKEGIFLSWPEPGKKLNLDEPTKNAIKEAVKECKSEFKSGSSVPVPPPISQIPSEEPNEMGGENTGL